MAKLYEIAQNVKQLEEVLEMMDEGDATYENVKAYLDNLKDVDLTEKVENILKYIKNLEADAEMYKAEKQRLDKLEKSSKKKADSLKNYLGEVLKGMGYDYVNKNKIKTSIGNVGFKKLPPSLKITDLSKVPEKYIKPRKMDDDVVAKKALLDDLKAELDMKTVTEIDYAGLGVKLVNNGQTLMIK